MVLSRFGVLPVSLTLKVSRIQAGYDEGVRSKMHDPTPMFEDQRFDSNLGGGAMMDLGCYCISALRNLSAEEPTCTSATPDVWSEPLRSPAPCFAAASSPPHSEPPDGGRAVWSGLRTPRSI